MKRSIARSTSPTPAGGDPDAAPLAAKKLRTARGGSRPGPLEISVAPTTTGVTPGDPPVSPASPATPSDAAHTTDPSDASAKRDSGSARLSGSSSAALPATAAVAADDGNVYLPASLAQYAQKRASDSSSILSAWNAILSSRELQRTTDPAADTGGIRGRGLTQTPPPTSSATAAGAHSAASSLTHGPHLERSHFTCEHQHEWVIPGYGRVRFTDYAPLAFKALREKFGYATSELTAALEEPLTVEKSSGKSDSVFFITQNKRFLFKTLRGSEPEELRALLPEYLSYIHQNPDTLLPRYLGMYTFQTVSRQPSYARVSPKDKPVLSILSQVFTVVVMASVFDTDVDIHEKYDFKGSTVGRQTLTDEMDITNGVVTMRRRRLSEGVSRPPRMADTKPRPLSSSSSTFEGGGSLLEPLDAPSLWKLEGSEQGFAAGGGTGSGSVLPSLHEDPSFATDIDSNLPASAGQLLADLTLKELDFQRLVGCGRSNLIHLGDAKREALIAQLESDFSLLRKNGFMDYSVLVGIHRKKKAPPRPPPTPHRRFPILDSLKGLASPSRPLSFFFGGGANPADASPAAAPADLLAPPTPVARPSRDVSASPTRRKSTLFGVLGGGGGVVPTPGPAASGDAQGRSMTPQEALLRRAVAAAAAAAAAARGARASAPAAASSVPAVAVAAAPNDSAAIAVDVVDAASEAHPDGAPQQAASPKSV
ncbi:Phosphatidylinositol 5-phosphate 4-kinase type-2 alpha, partial [Cladochytrium tenue]